jgi:dephospho-CoA kinase
MLKAGLTGSIGSGKSIVATVFGKIGIPVYYADHVAKDLLTHENVRKQLRQIFGETIFDAHGVVDRKLLGAIVFYNAPALVKLNDLIHPLVKDDFDMWLKEHSAYPYIIHEAAILFESGFNKYFDKVITVDAPSELCISRVMKRDGVSREDVLSRMQNQMDTVKKAALADFVIWNDEQSLVIPQVMEIHRMLVDEGLMIRGLF